MKKVKYKFDDKEIVIWAMLFLFTTVIFTLTILVEDFANILNVCGFVLVLILLTFLSFYWQNQFRLKRFYVLCNEIESHKIDCKYEVVPIKIKQKSFQIKPPMQSGDVEINIPVYTTESYSIQTSDFVILVFPVKDFGFIKKYIKPILLKKTDTFSSELINKRLVSSSEYEVRILNDNLGVSLKVQMLDIDEIIIPVETITAKFFM